MKKQIELLKQFHTAFGHPVESKPTELSLLKKLLRNKLIHEEQKEVEQELTAPQVSHEKLVKELCDLLVVTFGTIVECGYSDLIEDAFAEVMRSNMSKLGADGKPIYREDGKILKGPNYSEADIEQFFKK
jgi:predicted HAD superfamily Cof-like phosphohydrolase